MRTLCLAAILLASLLATPTVAKSFLQIDDFGDNAAPLIKVVTSDDSDWYWWTPYVGINGYDGYQPGRPPVASYQNVDGALGGQRDMVIGWEGGSSSGTVAVLSVTNQQAAISFPQNFAGGAYFQWDGDDFQGVDPSIPANVLPGARLNNRPGLGSYATTAYPEQNSDGISVDFTSAGKATGIYVEVQTDLRSFYFFDTLDVNGNFNTIGFQPTSLTRTGFFFRFDSANWALQSPAFDWTHVAGFQVRVWSFSIDNEAVDSTFSLLSTFGYVISGNVQQDSGCDGFGESVVQNVQIDIFESSSPTTLLTSTFTDVNGDFSFAGSFLVDQTSYDVCLHDLGAPRCTPPTGCFTMVLQDFQDPSELQFFLTTVSASPSQSHATNSRTPSRSPSHTPSQSKSSSATRSVTRTPSASRTTSRSPSHTKTPSRSLSASRTQSRSHTASLI